MSPSRLSTASSRARRDDTISKMQEPDRLGERSGSATNAISTRGLNQCRLAAKTAQLILANCHKFRQQPARE